MPHDVSWTSGGDVRSMMLNPKSRHFDKVQVPGWASKT